MKNSIAIIGMKAIFPDAMDLSEYWSNILAAKDSIKDVSNTYWEIEDFYDPNPSAKDKSYSYKAGEVGDVEFDSMGFGISPKVMESISVEQLYALIVAEQALLDAEMIGKNIKAFDNEKTGVIMAAGIGKSLFSLSRRQDVPKIRTILQNSGVPDKIAERVIQRMLDTELEWTENSEPGFLANVTAGRIANRFNLNGTNCAVDAACASSLAALKVAINELESGDCDIVLTGGVNLDLTATAFISFCKTPAISRSNVSRPFDIDADGMILGDGVGMIVLKRLEDAKRDGDRIYAVIKSIGSSGDGRATSIFAPNKEGQLKALNRAYEKTDVSPDTVSLIEAHGTGTHVGDGCELSALTQFFKEYDVKRNTVAIGSIKSQIGHSRLAAGIAGLIKTALAIYHRTLPPTINIKQDRPELLDSPFYTLKTPQPWIVDQKHPIRRAGVSSFGFGGTNFHVILEEDVDKASRKISNHNDVNWRRLHRIPVGICLEATTKNELVDVCESWIKRISEEVSAYDELLDSQKAAKSIAKDRPRVGFVSQTWS
jgi:acyl transferase domain-containing protein